MLRSPRELAGWLGGLGIDDPELSLRLADFRSLRDAIRSLLLATVHGRPTPADAVEAVNAASAAAPMHAELDLSGPEPRSVEISVGPAASRCFAGIARSAIELVGGEDRRRLRLCPADERVFLASRPRQVWCSDACGNRVRVARHRAGRRADHPLRRARPPRGDRPVRTGRVRRALRARPVRTTRGSRRRVRGTGVPSTRRGGAGSPPAGPGRSRRTRTSPRARGSRCRGTGSRRSPRRRRRHARTCTRAGPRRREPARRRTARSPRPGSTRSPPRRPSRPAGGRSPPRRPAPRRRSTGRPSPRRRRTSTGCAGRAPRSRPSRRRRRRAGCRPGPRTGRRAGRGRIRRILPSRLAGEWALPAGSPAFPPSPRLTYRSPSGPNASWPPLWFENGWSTDSTARRLPGSAVPWRNRYSSTRVSPRRSVRSTYRNRPSGENARPSRPCSPPSETRSVRSSTSRGAADPGSSARTAPDFSATYNAGSELRTTSASGCSSVAIRSSRTTAGGFVRSPAAGEDVHPHPVASVPATSAEIVRPCPRRRVVGGLRMPSAAASCAARARPSPRTPRRRS